jgi:hypothetical protein
MSHLRTSIALAVFLTLFATHLSAAEKRWKLSVENDDISGEKTHTLAVAADDGSALVLSARQGKPPLLTVVPAKTTVTIFPDATDIGNKSMSVNITMRSTKMPQPHSASWRMLWMNYGQASTQVTPDLASSVFSGESVTVQFDKMGKRIKFPTKGAGLDGFEEALQQTLDALAEEAAGKP